MIIRIWNVKRVAAIGFEVTIRKKKAEPKPYHSFSTNPITRVNKLTKMMFHRLNNGVTRLYIDYLIKFARS